MIEKQTVTKATSFGENGKEEATVSFNESTMYMEIKLGGALALIYRLDSFTDLLHLRECFTQIVAALTLPEGKE
jgi:hypothetical protein